MSFVLYSGVYSLFTPKMNEFPFKLSRDITEITPLWETPSLQPFLKKKIQPIVQIVEDAPSARSEWEVLHWCTLKVRGAGAARTGEQSIGTLCFSLTVDSYSEKPSEYAVLSECKVRVL